VPRQKQVFPSTPVPKRTGAQQEQQTRDTRNTIKKQPATTAPAHSTNKRNRTRICYSCTCPKRKTSSKRERINRGKGTKPAPAPRAEEPAPVAPPAQKGPTLAPA